MNRLRRRWMWWRHTWTFNQAHKPLCSRFENDVLKVFSLRVCRSCAMFYLGLVTATVALALSSIDLASLKTFFYTLLPLTVAFSHPRIYDRFPRAVRDVLRFSAGTLLPLSIAFLVLGSWVLGFVNLTLLLILHRLYVRGRPARKLHDCDGCPELERNAVCSGFTLQAAALRRYEQCVAEELMAEGYVPECVKRR